jgi:hypothetical protein
MCRAGAPSGTIAVGVLLFIFYVVLGFVFSFSSDFLIDSAYLSKSPFTSFFPERHSAIFILDSVIACAHVVFQLFPRWCQAFLILGHVVFTGYIIAQFRDLTMIKPSAQATIWGFLAAEAITDVLSAVL